MKTILLSVLMVASSAVYAIDLVTLDGKSSSVNAVQKSDMWTLVMLWSLDCAACEEQKPMIDNFNREHRNSNARVIAVSTDGDLVSQDVKMFLATQRYSFPNYLSLTKDFPDQFKVETNTDFLGTPTYLLYKPGGQFAGVHAGIITRQQLENIVGPAEVLTIPSADLMR